MLEDCVVDGCWGCHHDGSVWGVSWDWVAVLGKGLCACGRNLGGNYRLVCVWQWFYSIYWKHLYLDDHNCSVFLDRNALPYRIPNIGLLRCIRYDRSPIFSHNVIQKPPKMASHKLSPCHNRITKKIDSNPNKISRSCSSFNKPSVIHWWMVFTT